MFVVRNATPGGSVCCEKCYTRWQCLLSEMIHQVAVFLCEMIHQVAVFVVTDDTPGGSVCCER